MPKKADKPQSGRKTAKAQSTKTPKKTAKTGPAAVADRSAPRRLQLPRRVWYNPLSWRHRLPVPAYKPLPKARIIFANALRQLWGNKGAFGGIVLVYGLLNLALVRGLSGSSDLTNIKSILDSVLHGFGGKLISAAASFGYLLTTSASGNTADSGAYQLILLVVCSLAFIWALRQVAAGGRIRTKACFYQGMYPLVPFVLVLMLLFVQLIPLVGGGALYSIALSGGIAVHAWEKTLFLAVFLVLALWSLRMITASIVALYIVTLPDMTPLRAYRSARQLVYGRRLLVWRKLLFLPVLLLLFAALIELPLILYATALASWIFFGLSMVMLAVVHGYLYSLYRELL